MDMKLDDWQRIERVVRWAGLSVNSFARNIGLGRAENLYQIKKGNHGVSKELAEAVASTYPEISKAWLLTGEGEMFLSGSPERAVIPCYESDMLYLAAQESLPQASYLISVPRARSASFAALNLNNAMAPAIPQGAMVMLRECATDDIIPGNPYLVVSGRVTALRTVRREPGGEILRLVAANPDYDRMDLDICEVRRIFAVSGYLYYYQ